MMHKLANDSLAHVWTNAQLFRFLEYRLLQSRKSTNAHITVGEIDGTNSHIRVHERTRERMSWHHHFRLCLSSLLLHLYHLFILQGNICVLSNSRLCRLLINIVSRLSRAVSITILRFIRWHSYLGVCIQILNSLKNVLVVEMVILQGFLLNF